jgi:hypothetical protein
MDGMIALPSSSALNRPCFLGDQGYYLSLVTGFGRTGVCASPVRICGSLQLRQEEAMHPCSQQVSIKLHCFLSS